MSAGSDGCNTFQVLLTISAVLFSSPQSELIKKTSPLSASCCLCFYLHFKCKHLPFFLAFGFKATSKTAAHASLNLPVVYVYLHWCCPERERGGERGRVPRGTAAQSGTFTAHGVLLPQNWSYYLSAQIKIVKLIQPGCCTQRDGPPLQSTALWQVMILAAARSIC